MPKTIALIRLLAWCLLWSIGGASQALVLRDDRQVDVTINQPPQRIVSLLPSLTETVCALGQCQKLVGVDRYSNWPERIAHLPRMGGGLDPNIESVVAAKPDLVLMATSARGAARFEALGLKVLALEPNTHIDVQRVMHIVAKALAVPEAESERVWRTIDAAVNTAAQSIPAQAKGQWVYFEVGPAPHGASESSFIGETLLRLGARNILPASLGPFPKINPEFVVKAQPDLIMVGDSSFAEMGARPGWQNMRAIRSQRVCHFKAEESDVLVRAGPRMDEAARLMAQCLISKARTNP
ncbi:ABC transporter substrate-binding protein [Limnohabitans sp. Rim11]|jgi:iron complex transport system substrate-binding protein|uniref:ABC transporter substrate-binding protein n=1 Tax=Limnohabitans sp. Rim11 TaxID=1100719 RepID=UPI000A46A209|nr:helical backbone metal receptor [Limnohabitans sp. Rim11]